MHRHRCQLHLCICKIVKDARAAARSRFSCCYCSMHTTIQLFQRALHFRQFSYLFMQALTFETKAIKKKKCTILFYRMHCTAYTVHICNRRRWRLFFFIFCKTANEYLYLCELCLYSVCFGVESKIVYIYFFSSLFCFVLFIITIVFVTFSNYKGYK